jgi:hypothetical protein
MARRQGGSLFFSFFIGVMGASILWLYFPFLKGVMARPPASNAGNGDLSLKEATDLQARGSRFQMLNDGKQVFLVDLEKGRVWRYFHVTQGSKDQDGFQPLSMLYEGKQFRCASEVGDREPAQGNEVNQE